MKKSLIDMLSSFFEKHFKKVIAVLVISILVVPIIIWLCYSVFPTFIPTNFSADGLLNFFGTLVGSFSALLVGMVALYQGKKTIDITEELEIQKRRDEIRPYLQVQLCCIDRNLFEIIIVNHSTHPAIGVYIFENALFSAVSGSETKRKQLSFGEYNSTILAVDDYWYELNQNNYPKSINIVYFDVDNNIISQDFRYIGAGNPYEASNIQYM